MELYSFDDAYVRRLREGDSSTESHFVAYFNQLLTAKLRARYLAGDVVDDLRQETMIRVIRALRSESGLRQADRLGAFVNSVCNNVLQEHYRTSSRSQPIEDSHLEASGKVLNLEGLLIAEETSRRVRDVLKSLPERDRNVLRAIFLEEKEKDDVCSQFGVDRNYLRVLLHRAKDKFRQALGEVKPALAKAREGAAR